MAYEYEEITFPVLGGLDTLHNPADIPQYKGDEDWKDIVRMAQANNVFAPNDRYDLVTRPGFSDIRSTAINAAGIFTSFREATPIASRFLMTVSIAGGSHSIYQNSANPPAEITGGTNFTIGQDNLVSAVNFTDGTTPMSIFASLLRDKMQSVEATPTRADFTPTGTILAKSIRVFDQRLIMMAPSVGGTVYRHRNYHSDKRDGNLLTDSTTQFSSFEASEGEEIQGIEVFGQVLFTGMPSRIYFQGITPFSTAPLSDPREFEAGQNKGFASSHGQVVADDKLWWISYKGIHCVDRWQRTLDLDNIKPVILGLNQARIQYAVTGYDHNKGMVLFSVSNGSDTIHKTVIGVNVKTLEAYVWTISANAMGIRLVSSEPRLVLGGYVGKLRDFGQGATGDLDDASALIDADIITPRHHCGAKDWIKLFAGVKVRFDPQGSEAVTLQFRLNDESSWSTFSESPYSVTGTAGDTDTKFFAIGKAGTSLQLRFRDAISGDVMRIQSYTIVYKKVSPGLTRM